MMDGCGTKKSNKMSWKQIYKSTVRGCESFNKITLKSKNVNNRKFTIDKYQLK